MACSCYQSALGMTLLSPGRCRAKEAGENTLSTTSNLEGSAWYRGTSGCAPSFLMASFLLLYFASPSLSIKHSSWINTTHVRSETNGLNFYTRVLYYFPVPSPLVSVRLLCFSYCSWICIVPVRPGMLQQPGMICLLTLKLWTSGKSDPFAAWAKHCIYEVYILKIYGNPITLHRSEYCNILPAKCS